MHREQEQLSLADALRRQRPGGKRGLEQIDAVLDWAAPARLLRETLHAGRRGRPAYDPLAMFKALLLGELHGLSDAALEEELWDRESFRRFAGFPAAEPIPDHTTLCRFRSALREAGLHDALFAELQEQLAARGLSLKAGRAALDATLVDAQASRKRVDSARGPSDPDAAFTRSRGKHRYGYKAHLNVDLDSLLILAAELTPANVNETTIADQLLTGRERSVHADRAYDTAAREALYAELRISYAIMRRGNRHHPLPEWERQRNRRLHRVRMPMEGVFGVLKRCYGYRRVRFFNLARNRCQLLLLCFAYNLRRAAQLTAA